MPTEPADSSTPVLDPAPAPQSPPGKRALAALARTPGGGARHVLVVDGLRGIAILLVLLFHYWQL
ncbi:MAG TPA: hypothetical protein VFO16_03020, partial [Pseudonocardiaceae bacterium]|nr:hypothetical protein [Pseudonocardiaceae bacterium]